MLKISKIKSLVILSLMIALIFTGISTGAVNGQADPFSEIKDKLSGISEKEKEILQKLFTLAQEIELMETGEKKLAQEIKALNQEVKVMETEISKGELAYDKKQDSLRRVLQSYQRMGPGSFLEIILDSDSLDTFLQRVNILRDLTRNTGELLDELEASKEKLSEEKARLSEKLSLLEEKQKQSREAIDVKMKLKTETEEYLASLKGEREYYQEQLTDLERVWDELKPLISKTAKEFSRMLEEDGLPADALKISFSLFEIRGAIEDNVINQVVADNAGLSNIVFAFHPGIVEISVPEKDLMLTGTFIIQEGNVLKFKVQEGSFFGIPLEAEALEELFGDGGMTLNLDPLLKGNTIHALEIKEGYLELIHKFDLF